LSTCRRHRSSSSGTAQLKRLSEHKRVSQQKLIAEAFNLLFEKHGLPPIA
jgi:hypothetical protein